MPQQTVTRGRVVRYTLPNGWTRVAIVTHVYYAGAGVVDLTVLHPAHTIERGVTDVGSVARADTPTRGCWHWPDQRDGAEDVQYVAEPEPESGAAAEVVELPPATELTSGQEAGLAAIGQEIVDQQKAENVAAAAVTAVATEEPPPSADTAPAAAPIE